MANVTAERSTNRNSPESLLPLVLNLPVAASTKIFKGAMVAASTVAATKGQAVKAGATTLQQVIGIANATVDNSAGAAAALSIDVRCGTFALLNSATTDLIDLQHVGQPCYAADDQTVALTDNGGARPLAGTVAFVDSSFVWVTMGVACAPNIGQHSMGLAIDLTTAANATLLTWTPQFNGKIKKITFTASKPAAGAGATVTITPNIAAAPITGGVLTLTLANVIAAAEIAATAVTGAQMFAAGQAITLVGSAFTAFTAGSGTIYLHVG